MITSYWGEEGQGARRRYYAITEGGRSQWKSRFQEWKETKELLDALITAEAEGEVEG